VAHAGDGGSHAKAGFPCADGRRDGRGVARIRAAAEVQTARHYLRHHRGRPAVRRFGGPLSGKASVRTDGPRRLCPRIIAGAPTPLTAQPRPARLSLRYRRMSSSPAHPRPPWWCPGSPRPFRLSLPTPVGRQSPPSGIQNYGRPDGNVTGFLNVEDTETKAKTIDLLRELLPGITKVAIVYGPDAVPGGEAAYITAFRSLAAVQKLELVSVSGPHGSGACRCHCKGRRGAGRWAGDRGRFVHRSQTAWRRSPRSPAGGWWRCGASSTRPAMAR